MSHKYFQNDNTVFKKLRTKKCLKRLQNIKYYVFNFKNEDLTNFFSWPHKETMFIDIRRKLQKTYFNAQDRQQNDLEDYILKQAAFSEIDFILRKAILGIHNIYFDDNNHNMDCISQNTIKAYLSEDILEQNGNISTNLNDLICSNSRQQSEETIYQSSNIHTAQISLSGIENTIRQYKSTASNFISFDEDNQGINEITTANDIVFSDNTHLSVDTTSHDSSIQAGDIIVEDTLEQNHSGSSTNIIFNNDDCPLDDNFSLKGEIEHAVDIKYYYYDEILKINKNITINDVEGLSHNEEYENHMFSQDSNIQTDPEAIAFEDYLHHYESTSTDDIIYHDDDIHSDKPQNKPMISQDGDIETNSIAIEDKLQESNRSSNISLEIKTVNSLVEGKKIQINIEKSETAFSFKKTLPIPNTKIITSLEDILNDDNLPVKAEAEEVELPKKAQPTRMNWDDYQRLDVIYSWMDKLESDYPSICTVGVIGKSLEGRDMKLLKVSNSNSNNTSVWIDAGIHAREWIAPATCTYIADHIVKNFRRLPKSVTSKDWYFLPVVNPDGYEYTHTTNRMWRKNRAYYKGQQCGVDLNRNFSCGYGGKGSSDIPGHAFFRGPGAFSEPESKAVRDMILNSGVKFKVYITLHCFGEVIIFPFAHRDDLCRDYIRLLQGATAMSKAIFDTHGTIYKVGISRDVMYKASGTSNDWSYGEAKIPYCYLVELRNRKNKTKLPREEIQETGMEMLNAIKALMKFVDVYPLESESKKDVKNY